MKKLSKEELFAIDVAFGELDNSGDWAAYYNDKDHKMIGKGREQFKKRLEEKDED